MGENPFECGTAYCTNGRLPGSEYCQSCTDARRAVGLPTADTGIVSRLVDALEAARHELTTLHGLEARDYTPAIGYGDWWVLDCSAVLAKIDAVLPPPPSDWQQPLAAADATAQTPLFAPPAGTDAAQTPDAAGGEARDAKGADPAEWPEDLRVREFPRAAGTADSAVPPAARRDPPLPDVLMATWDGDAQR